MTSIPKKDRDKILSDGERLTVRMHMMDNLQIGVAGTAVAAQAHKPGSLPLSDEDIKRRSSSQESYETAISHRWRDPQPAGAESSEPRQNHIDAYASYEMRLTSAWRHR
jgi:hypothetical protein